MKKIFLSVLLTMIVSSLAIKSSLCDVVEFKSGYSIKGKVISVNDKTVKIRQNKVTLEISRKQIKNILYSQNKTTPKASIISTAKKVTPVGIQKKQNLQTIKHNENKKNTTVEPMQVSLKPKITLEEDKSKEVSFLDKGSGIFSDKKKTIFPNKTENTNNNFVKDEKANNTTPNLASKLPLVDKPIIKSTLAEGVLINYQTKVRGANSSREYLGIYTHDTKESRFEIKLSTTNPSRLSFKLHSQKNGILSPVPASVSVEFLDENLNQITITKTVTMDVDNFVEWIKNLENIAGIAGEKFVSTSIPSKTKFIRIIGIKPDSRPGLTGYISDIALDNNYLSTR